jgi:hypothetical protein
MIAAQHYLQTRDAHFDLATGGAESGANCGALEAQKAAQHPSAPVRTDSHDSQKTPCFVGFSQRDANKREAVQSVQVGPAGFEPATERL